MSQAVQIQTSIPMRLDTTTPLAAGGVFISPGWDFGDTSLFPTFVWSRSSARELVVVINASHASAANGAAIQADFSGNWRDVVVGTVAAGVPLILRAPVVWRNYRIVLTNGATAQTHLAIASAAHN